MIPHLNLQLFLISYVIILSAAISNVLELNEKFINIAKEGQWLIMLYAPWCGHCKKIEPIWEDVANYFQNSRIKVGRIDCTRYTSVAHHFKIKGFPTILFLKGDQEFSYNGDRTKTEILKFAERLSGHPVQKIKDFERLMVAKHMRELWFLYIGEETGSLWDSYNAAASELQPYAFFYHSDPFLVHKDIFLAKDVKSLPTVLVYKEQTYYEFPNKSLTDLKSLNESLNAWINAERFLTFPKITRGNINQLYSTKKNLVVAVVEENQIGEITPDMLDFVDLVESLVKRMRRKYHKFFQFGWTSTPELANSITLSTVYLPSLIVINTSSNHYYMYENHSSKVEPRSIITFLDQVLNGTAPKLGGNGLLVRLNRTWYELKMVLISLWKGNPILTLALFGLPTTFLFLICKMGVCSPDIIEDEDDDDDAEPDNHSKND